MLDKPSEIRAVNSAGRGRQRRRPSRRVRRPDERRPDPCGTVPQLLLRVQQPPADGGRRDIQGSVWDGCSAKVLARRSAYDLSLAHDEYAGSICKVVRVFSRRSETLQWGTLGYVVSCSNTVIQAVTGDLQFPVTNFKYVFKCLKWIKFFSVTARLGVKFGI